VPARSFTVKRSHAMTASVSMPMKKPTTMMVTVMMLLNQPAVSILCIGNREKSVFSQFNAQLMHTGQEMDRGSGDYDTKFGETKRVLKGKWLGLKICARNVLAVYLTTWQ
jgi:hypothetical protein